MMTIYLLPMALLISTKANYILGILLAALILSYMIYSLIKPEKF